ncbi:MAG: hypothetical protein N2167_10050 [Flavobacteriales bacterium]|nr:hypothetical protein [Flavobacteriales bacterium]
MKIIKNSALSLVYVLLTCAFFFSCGNSLVTIPCSDVNSDTVWENRNDGVDYVLNCVVTVNARLTIEPGVVIECKANSGIIVENGGAIVAVGNDDDKIEFIGELDQQGVWKGIFIKSNNPLNQISHCIIKNGGSSSLDGISENKANIRVSNNAKLTITNSVISKSGKDGLRVDGIDASENNPLTTCANNTFSNNQNYPVSVPSSCATSFDGLSSIYENNGINKMHLRAGRMIGTHSWKKMNIPYLVEGIAMVGNSNNSGNLTIDPGVVVQFAGDAGLTTADYSTNSWLRIVGTSDERITLTGETLMPGAWKGVAFQSTHLNNEMAFVNIACGGSSSYTGATQKRANIHVGAWSAGSLTISETNVSNSSAWGIWINANSASITIPPSVTFNNNASGDVYDEP